MQPLKNCLSGLLARVSANKAVTIECFPTKIVDLSNARNSAVLATKMDRINLNHAPFSGNAQGDR